MRSFHYWAWRLIALLVILGGLVAVSLTGQWTLAHARTFSQEFEQAAIILENGSQDPAAAIAAARPHLAAARAELEILRPIAEPAVTAANRLPNLPIVGPYANHTTAMWTFANASTLMSEALLNAAELGLTGLNKGPSGLATAMPAIQNQLQVAQANLAQAQTARNQMNQSLWWPDDLAAKQEKLLSRWDTLAPLLGTSLEQIIQLGETIDIEQSWAITQNLVHELEQAADILDKPDGDWIASLSRARPHLTAARADIKALQPMIQPLQDHVGDLPSLPGVNFPLEQITAWWQFADAITRLGDELTSAANLNLLSLEKRGLPGLIAATPALRPHLRLAQASFYQARAARSRLQTATWLPDGLGVSLDNSLSRWDKLASEMAEWLPKVDRIAAVLPQLSGSERPVTYLLLVQSSDELRATGGFIGGIGTIRLEKGKITTAKLGEITGFDNQLTLHNGQPINLLQPPDPFIRYMGFGHWYLRDANWWADFPVSARRTIDLWGIANNTPVDGIIAITDQGLAALLEAVGPVKTLNGQTVDAQNAKTLAAKRIYLNGQNHADEQSALLKEMALLFVALTDNLPPEQSLRFGQSLQEAVIRRDLLIASFDPVTAATLRELGIDGAVEGQRDDYFYLVEANLSYNKLSPFIQQNLTYEVELGADGRATAATLTVDEVNTYEPGAGLAEYPAGYYDGGRWNQQTWQLDKWAGYYGGYTRLYPPPNSKFLAATGFDDGPEITTENDRIVMGGYVGLLPHERQQLTFKWLPNNQPSTPGQYRLLVQRQPGAPAHALTIFAHLPAGYHAADITPTPIAVNEETITWHALLNRDQTFSIRLEGNEFTTTTTITQPITSSLPVTDSISSTTHYTVAPAPPPPPGRAPQPIWINIPAITVSTAIVPVGLEKSGIMASPAEADLVGWYELGPRPGEPSNAVLAGHINWKGRTGAFVRLSELQPGDLIEIQNGPDTGYRFVVESLETYQADTAPVAEIFGPTSEAMLTLITCGGPYDASRQVYRDRLVVRARGLN